MQSSTSFYFGICGIIASILVGVGEFYLHYSPNVLNGIDAFIIHLQIEINEPTFQKLIDIYENNYEVLVQILRIVIALLSAAFVYSILKFKTIRTKRMAIFNPITILLFFIE